MAQPVWLLSVDLQTKTATFQTGLADAAKAARGSFNDIKGGAGEMGGAVGYSTGEARHSVMLLGEEFGVHLPRALTTFIAGLGPIGPALEAAFPFLAIAVGATLLIEKLVKMHEAGEKLTTDQLNFGTAANNALSTLDEKLLQVQIKADDLSGNHMAALKHQLELIDHQSLNELQHSFLELARSMEPVMKDLEGHWYTFGEGSDGAKHALDDFRTHYEYLLSKGNSGEASGLLHGTLDQAKKTLAMMDQLKASQSTDGKNGNYQAYEQAAAYLEKMGVISKVLGDYTQKTYDAQLNLVSALSDQATAEQRIADIKKLEGQNATTSTHKEMGKEAESAARKKAEEQTRLEREYLQNFKHDQQDLINATREGTADRLDALQAAMDATADLYGRDNETYKQYASEYLRTWNDMSAKTLEAIGKELDEEDRLKAEAARESADNDEKMGQLSIAAEKQRMALEDSARRVTIEQRIAEETRIANEEYAIKMAALQKEIQGLDKSGKDYENKLKQLQDKEKQLTQQHANEMAAIKDKAAIESNQRISASYQQFVNATSQGLTQSIMGHQTWARMVQSLGDQVVSGMLENAIKSAMLLDFDKEKQAGEAARWGFVSGMKLPFPANIIAAPVLAAGAFAAVMAFEGGTDRVPGIGRGDVVPTMLTPGEGVVPGGVMDGLRNMARNGGFDQGPRNVLHMHVTNHVQTIDGDGMETALQKNADTLQRHFENTLRRMNR
jgi:hypothetical protein